MTNGFGGTKDDQADLAQGFGEQGYVTLSYTGLGFVDGDNCPITLDDVEHDGAAASQLHALPRRRPVDRGRRRRRPASRCTSTRWSARTRPTGTQYDPQVGMTGGSYGGQIQFAAAGYENAAGTNRLDAIVPLITWNDLSYSLAPENSGLPAGHGAQRLGELVGHRRLQVPVGRAVHHGRRRNGAAGRDRAARPGQRVRTTCSNNCAQLRARGLPGPAEVGTLGYPSQASIAFLRSNSVASYMGDVRVPTLLGQGQADTLFNLQESVATYTALKRQGTPGLAGLAVVGPQRPDAAARRARHAAPRAVARRAARRWPGSTTTSADRGTAPPQDFTLLPRLGLPGDARHHPGLRDGAVLPGRQASRRTTCPAPAPAAPTARW